MLETCKDLASKPTTINNNTQFNVMNYLNTECADAMNLSDFINEFTLFQSKKQNNIIRDIEKLKKQEKKDGHDVKDIDAIQKMIKKGLETEMYDDMEIMTGRTLKQLDKHMMNMDTMPREDIAQIIMKQDIDLYDMIFGY